MGVRTGKTAAKSTAEARASTAPTPGGKKWLGKNPGSTSQLPSPAVVQSEIPETLVVVEADRPQTCPATTLVPQFHWNLNASALKTLTRDQVEQLYGLFKFYDSSMIGDALPSINCARLVEILRDARLLNSAMPVGKGLSVESVERIFAQAVMGKMRVYLDADDQPALTFPLFCGALMNCAMLLAPSLHPEPALRQILPTLLEGPIVGHQYSPAKGLLRHVPVNGATSLWIAGESHGPLQLEEATQDYRDLAPFQQVIADCTRDKILEEIKQEKLARVYEVPPQLAATFHEDTLALISNKFRLFDTFDRGWLPRHEVFSLLSSVGRRADLPDPHAVLAALTAAHANTTSEAARNLGRRSSADSGTLTLVQVLQAIEVTREAARLSTAAHLASKKVIPNRVKSAAPSGLGSTSSSQNTGAATSTLVENMDSGCNNDSSTDASKDDPQSNGITHSGGVFATRKIVDVEGIYYTTAPSETTHKNMVSSCALLTSSMPWTKCWSNSKSANLTSASP
ncbi:hypothetical protein PHYBOEH_011721 [Phytophthora boehmeriae]|uniref:EF-hand domain-containing protein n=1 Tax=Phytophthora boehmeriae TaxID=109152 RepID=A0A8T1WW79_9STRA|nr:hypothetical protein PHYBOEH_011721 [Phytophthora boehmeriae]